MKWICFLILFLTIEITGFSQIYPIENFSIKDGLPQSNVWSIFQDDQGFMWFGTEAGICRYNGKKFQTFDTASGIANNYIKNIIQDTKGNIWFSTFGGGVTCYDWKHFHSFTTKEGLTLNEVNSIIEDKRHPGIFWIGTAGGGLCKFNGEKVIQKFDTKQGLPDITLTCMIQTEDGNFWIGTDHGGVCKFDGKSKFIIYNDKNGLPDNRIKSIIEDKNKNIWIGTKGGLVKYNNKNFKVFTTDEGLPHNSIQSLSLSKNNDIYIGTNNGISISDGETFKNITTKNGLTADYIISIYHDRQGVMWLGTFGKGVDKYTGKRFQIFSSQDGLSYNVVHSICQDRKGNMWFGTENGISCFDGKDFKNYNVADGLGSPIVMTSYVDRQGNVWFGTFSGKGGAIRWNGKKFDNYSDEQGLYNNVWSIYQDKDDNMWFGTYSHGVYKWDEKNFTRYTSKDNLAGDNVTTIFQDKQGSMWFGTYGNGLSKYDGKKFTNYNSKNGLSNDNVWAFLQDKDDNIWIATDGGINIFNGKKFQTLSEKDGLHSNTIWIMLADNDGNIWIGHEKGVEKIDFKTRKSKYFGYMEGFTPIEVNAGAGFKDKDGSIWFGTFKGVVKYSAIEDKQNPFMPITHITGINLFNKEVDDWKSYAEKFDYKTNLPIKLVLPYDQNFITFNYIGIHSEAPLKVRYQYMLKGFDKDWQPLTDQTDATYSNLSPGDYTFMVKAQSGSGVWNKQPVEYTFRINPPFWERWWFYVAQILFFVSLFTSSVYISRKGGNEKLATPLLIVSLLVITEFLQMNLENYLQDYTGGIPIIHLFLNVVLALLINPIEDLSEKLIKKRKFKGQLEDIKSQFEDIQLDNIKMDDSIDLNDENEKNKT